MYFRANRRSANVISLSETVDGDGDGSALALMDLISIEDQGLREIEHSDRYEQMFAAINTCLDAREKEILALRYGLGGKTPLTQREIASTQSISRSYVSRIEKKALEKLRKALETPDD